MIRIENYLEGDSRLMSMAIKKSGKRFLLCCIFPAAVLILSLFPAAAQSAVKEAKTQPVILTIEQAVDYANKNSRTLKSARIDLEMSERASKYSWNVFLPALTVSGTASRANDYVPGAGDIIANAIYHVPIPSSYESEKDRWTGIGNISVSLNLSLALIQRIRAAHANFESGKITWTQASKQNELNIRKLFYALLLQQENLKVQETSLKNARQRALQAEVNYKNGMVPELSMLQAQVTYENQRPNVDKERQALSQQLDSFAFLLGMPVGTKIELVGEITPKFINIDAEEVYPKYGMNNLDVLNIKRNIDVLKLNLNALNLSSFTPALSLGWNYQPILMTGGKWTDSDSRYDNGNFSITLAWTISDILPFSANRQSAKDIEDNIRKLEVSLDTLIQNNELIVRKTADSLAQAKEAIESNERNIKLAQRSYDMTAIAYRNGTTELLDLRDAETQLNQAKLGMLNEQYNYISYRLDLEYILNTQLTGEIK